MPFTTRLGSSAIIDRAQRIEEYSAIVVVVSQLSGPPGKSGLRVLRFEKGLQTKVLALQRLSFRYATLMVRAPLKRAVRNVSVSSHAGASPITSRPDKRYSCRQRDNAEISRAVGLPSGIPRSCACRGSA